MKKINQIATISNVTLNDKLKEWNEENNAFRVQLRIAYAAENSKDEEDDNLLSLADFEEAGASVGKTYTCLINFDSLLTDKHTEKEQDKALAKLVEKFKGEDIVRAYAKRDELLANREEAMVAEDRAKIDEIDTEIKEIGKVLNKSNNKYAKEMAKIKVTGPGVS